MVSGGPGAEEPAAAVPAEAQRQQRQVVAVSRLWAENCQTCHGDRGQGGGAGTQSLLTTELFRQEHDRRFFDAIKHGVPEMAMPSYGDTLSEEEIWGLVVHIRELQARALRRELGAPAAENGVVRTKLHAYRIETAVDEHPDMRTPWGVAWLPDGRMLITTRPGPVFVARNGQLLPAIQGIPESREIGQGGMMEVAVHPDYARNGWIYLGYTEPAKDNPRAGMTKIVRGKLRFEGDQAHWVDQQTIFEAPAASYTGAGVHFGCRIVFDGKGHVFFSIGDRGQMEGAQDLSRANGNIYRLREDGSVPADNPFVGREEALKGIWSFGHRNPQGLAFDLDGRLWDTEHGPRGGDELNLIERGANYGWPTVSFGINYNDAPFRTPWPAPGQKITQPIYRWIPSIGACGLAVADGKAFPQWKGDLLAGGLSGANIDRIRTKDGDFVEREEIFFGHGRVRDVRIGPDGYVYVALNQPDKIVRLVPAP
jgi:aldose sugar dehydrogenase